MDEKPRGGTELRRKIRDDSRRQAGLPGVDEDEPGIIIVPAEIPSQADVFWQNPTQRRAIAWIGVAIVWILGLLFAFGLGYTAVYLYVLYGDK